MAKKRIVLDYRGLKTPKPLMSVRKEITNYKRGDILEIYLTDPQCIQVIPVYLEALGHKILSKSKVNEEYTIISIEIT